MMPVPNAAADSTLFLVSCVGQKRSIPSPARDLYTSQWFKKARAYVDANGGRWFILSAEYGLLVPEKVVAPYERTLNRMPIGDRRAWARRVLEALASRLGGVERVVVLAGDRYREFLVEPLGKLGVSIDVPMAGLGIGEQLHWLEVHVQEGR
jgi:hypothetical protein